MEKSSAAPKWLANLGVREVTDVMAAPTHRKEVYYSGTVQGVGFRYTVQRVARNYDVMGFVRNLPDGRVELIAEGPAKEIESFLGDIDQRMAGYIRDRQTNDAAPTGEFDGFAIRF